MCIDHEEFLGFLSYFHLVISLAQVKFANMLTPHQIRKNILYAWQRILFCKKYCIDWDLEIATHTHWKRENPDATPLDTTLCYLYNKIYFVDLKYTLYCALELTDSYKMPI